MPVVFRKFIAVSVITMALAGALMPLTVVNAADPEVCACYCTNFNGAQKPVDEDITSAECNTKCTEQKETVAAFACGANQHPSRTAFCFDAEECAAQNGKIDETGYQPPECTTGFKYCYPTVKEDQKVQLQVTIGTYSTSIDFGEYVGAMYKWMVSSAVFLAIIMLMVGGLRYSFGAASDQIAGAKKMMVNAMTGLVLLLCTYLILFTVNPDLVSLQVPRLPMIKQIALVDNADCAELKEEGWDIDFDGPEECGTVGTVNADDEGAPVPDGTMCNFMNCGSVYQYCVPGDEPQCMGCEELTVNNTAGVMASSQLCSKFNSLVGYTSDFYESNVTETVEVEILFTGYGAPPGGKIVKTKEEQVKSYRSCMYTRDGDAGGNMVSQGACVMIAFSCDSKDQPKQPTETKEIDSCSDYDHIKVKTGSGYVELEKFDIGKNPGIGGSDTGVFKLFYNAAGDFTLNTFCRRDMCKWNKSNQEDACGISKTSLVPYSGVNAMAPGSYDCQTFGWPWN
jgi:hypothetical protein